MRWTMEHVLFVCIKQNNIYSHNLSNPEVQNIERVSQAKHGTLQVVRHRQEDYTKHGALQVVTQTGRLYIVQVVRHRQEDWGKKGKLW